MTTDPSPTTISPPLPLPIHFTLLPSLLPNRALAPVLYSYINTIPIYLTLLPAHPPHLSILPLLIALFPTSPLHLIKLFPPGTWTADLGGNAPFEDVWVPLSRARELCARLGVARVFADDGQPELGLLGKHVEDAISWEEEGVICHNWMPSARSLPASSYSLDRLLDTPFPGIDIIPEDRYITTSCDKARKARIVNDASISDHSTIRRGVWKTAWSDYLRCAASAWDEFLIYPSEPPSGFFAPTDTDARIMHRLAMTLTTVVSGSGKTASGTTRAALAYPMSELDLAACLAMHEQHAMTIPSLLLELVQRLFASLRFPWRASSSATPKVPLFELERRARIQLSLVELVGALLVDRLRAELDTTAKNMSRPASEQVIVLSPAPDLAFASDVPVPSPPAGSDRTGKPLPTRTQASRQSRRQHAQTSSEDDLTRLERRRGGSPTPGLPARPPSRSSRRESDSPTAIDTPKRQSAALPGRVKSGRGRYSFGSAQGNEDIWDVLSEDEGVGHPKVGDEGTAARRTSRSRSGSARSGSLKEGSARRGNELGDVDGDHSAVLDAAQDWAGDMVHDVVQVGEQVERLMLSEQMSEWWVYASLLGAVILALGLDMVSER